MTRTAAPPTPAPDGPKAVSKFEYNLLGDRKSVV